MLTVLDLFSGIGGFSFGLERTGGFKTIQFVEIDEFCQRVLRKHWPLVPIHGDITTFSACHGFADVVCGGFPCQDISIAGKGAGLAGARSGLWREYARIIGLVRPRYVIVENVAALLHRGLDAVLGELASLGYDAEWHCIPASAVGAPHLRDRIWIIAYTNGDSCRRDKYGGAISGPSSKSEETQRRSYRKRCRPRLADGTENGDSSDADSLRQSQSQGSITDERRRFRDGAQASDDTYNWGQRIQGLLRETVSRIKPFSWCEDVRRIKDFFGRPDIPEPLIRRSDNGLSKRVDRLGNAVVPQIPELIGRAILEHARR